MTRNTIRTLLLSTAILAGGVGIAAAQGMDSGGGARERGSAGAQAAPSGAAAQGGGQVKGGASAGRHISGGASAGQNAAVSREGRATSRISGGERAGARASTRNEAAAERGASRDRTSRSAGRDGAERRTRSAVRDRDSDRTNRRADRGETRHRETTGQASRQTSRDDRDTTRATRDRSRSDRTARDRDTTRRDRADSRTQNNAQIRTGRTTITARQQSRLRQSIVGARNAPRLSRVDFRLRTGVRVPRHVHFASVTTFPVLFDVFPDYRDYSFFIAEDDIVFVDDSREIVDVVPLEGGFAQASVGGGAVFVDVDLDPDEIREVQTVLVDDGFDLRVTGVWDVRTRRALVGFQRRHHLRVGAFDTRTVAALRLNGKIDRDHIRGGGRAETTGRASRSGERSHDRMQTNTSSMTRDRNRATTGQGAAQARTNDDNATAPRGQERRETTGQGGRNGKAMERSGGASRSTAGQSDSGRRQSGSNPSPY